MEDAAEVEAAGDCSQRCCCGFGGSSMRRIMLSSSRSGPRLALLLLPVLVSRVYLASEGGVGTRLPLPPVLTLESPPPARSALRTSARRMFAAAFLAGERPREGSVANGTITGGDMPVGSVRSSSLSAAAEKDGTGFGERRSMIPDQSRGSVCAGRYGLRAGVAVLGREDSGRTTWVCTVGLDLRVLDGPGAGAGACTVSSAATVVTLSTVKSASESRSTEAEVDAG